MRHVVEVAQPRHRLRDQTAGLGEHARETLALLHGRLDLVEAEIVGDLLGEVDDVVQRRGQLKDVFAVDRGDERAVEGVDHVVGDAVTLVLAGQDLARELPGLGVVAQQSLEQVRGPDDVSGGLLEQVEELTAARREHLGETCHSRHAA